MEFCPLHIHTEFSLLDGFCKIKDLVAKAAAMKFPYLGITDHASISGGFRFIRSCKEAGIRPIIGCEFYVVDDLNWPGLRAERNKQEREQRFHVLVLAKSWVGLQSISLALTKASFNFFRKPRIDWDDILGLKDVIVATACSSGVLSHPNYEEKVIGLRERFGEDLYLEIMPLDFKNQIEINYRALDLSRRLGIGLLASNDVHYIEKEEAFSHEILLALQRKTTLDDPKRWKFDVEGLFLKSEEEMIYSFEQLGMSEKIYLDALHRTTEVAEKCCWEFSPLLVSLPSVRSKFLGNLEENKTTDEQLIELCFNKIMGDDHFRKKKNFDEYSERLIYELDRIIELGFSGYFLIVQDLINHCRKMGIFVGPGRGSASGSLVCYLLDITRLDPVKYKLLFDRFISPARIDLPDIDMDFEDKRRGEVIDYLKRKYGKDHVAGVVTWGEMKARMALKDVARVFKVPQKDVNDVTKLIVQRTKGDERTDFSLEDSFQIFEGCKRFEQKYPQVVGQAKKFEGLVRQRGRHAAAVVVSAVSLKERAPLITETNGGETLVAYDKYDLDDLGLMKLDILGLRTLSILSLVKQLVLETKGKELDFESIPLDDKKVFEELGTGNALAVFQMESEGFIKLLRSLAPITEFETLVAANTLHRPGGIKSGIMTSYVQRRRGLEKIEYMIPYMEELTRDTYGLIIYQEQIMLALYELAGFTWKTADTIRKIISKSQGQARFAKFTEQFVEGCKNRHNIPEKISRVLFKEMSYSGSYSFNRSHSATYTLIGYWCCYCKIYYTAEFFASYLALTEDKNKVIAAIKDALRLGVKFLPPDINISNFHWKIVLENTLQVGLLEIKGLGEIAARAILDSRESGSFKNIEDFLYRIDRRKVNKQKVQILAKAGLFDNISINRKKLIEALPLYLGGAIQKGKGNLLRLRGKNRLFGESGDLLSNTVFKEDLFSAEDFEEKEKQQMLISEMGGVSIFPVSFLSQVLSTDNLRKYLFKEKLMMLGINELNSKQKSLQELYLLGLVKDIKYGFKQKVAFLGGVAGASEGRRIVSDYLGGIYGNFEDATDFMMVVYGSDLYRSNKELLESLAGSICLVRGGIKIIGKDNFFVDDLVSIDRLDQCLTFQQGQFSQQWFNLNNYFLVTNSIVDLWEEICDCYSCGLGKEGKGPVLADYIEGKARFMIIGEAPGREEESQGVPFVGKAGILLMEILNDIGLNRNQAYITNVIKCRPPDNRKPSSVEVKKCKSWLEKEIEMVRPLLILALGNTAAEFFSGQSSGILDRNASVEWNFDWGCWIVYSIHPAAVLYEADKLPLLKESIEKVGRFYDLAKKVGQRRFREKE